MEWIVLILGLSLFSSLCITSVALRKNREEAEMRREIVQLREWKLQVQRKKLKEKEK